MPLTSNLFALLYKHSADVAFKKHVFIASFFIFTFVSLFLPVLVQINANSMGQSPLNAPSAALMLGASFLVATAMKKQKIFRNKAIVMFMSGTILYLLYGWFVSAAGETLYATARAYRELLAVSVFSATLFLSARIVIAYDLKIELAKTICVAFGITLITAYVTHFDNLAFIGHVGDIFNKSARYRYGFGLGHVNGAGRKAMLFLVWSAVYRVLNEEKGNYSARKDNFNVYFLRPASIVAVIILLSSASRASITSLILFFMAYFFHTFRSKLGAYMRVLLAMSVVLSIYLVIILVDWNMVFVLSNRMENFASIDTIVQQKAWLTGLGFIKFEELFQVLNLPYLDNYYLLVFLQSGLVGFMIHFGTIFLFVKCYFQDSAGMTKFQRLAGGLLAVYLYYGLFEALMFGHGAVDMASWILFFIAINQKAEAGEKYSLRHRKI